METRKMKCTVLFSLVLFVGMATSVIADTYYVDATNGNDNWDGSQLYPKRTIEAAVAVCALPPNCDTIIIAPGIYKGDWIGECDEWGIWTYVWHAAIDPQGRNIIFKSQDPNDPYIVESTIIYGGYVNYDCIPDTHCGGDDDDHLYPSKPCKSSYMPCCIFEGGADCQLIGLTIKSGFITGQESPSLPDASSYSNEGAIVCKGSSVTISNCIIDGDTSSAYADISGIYLDDSGAVIQDCTISIPHLQHNPSGDAFPPVKITGASNVTIKDSNVSNNNVRWDDSIYTIEIYADPVYSERGNLTIEHCTISGNKGPGVRAWLDSNVTVTDCTTIDGGGLYKGLYLMNSGDINITGSTIRNCGTSIPGCGTNGAGIWIENALSKVKIDSCTLTGNTSDDSGGAICIDDFSTADINNCTIGPNNKAGGCGGGIYAGSAYANKNITISKCTIRDNEASVGGGGIYTYTPTTVTHCKITGNKALQQGAKGGGIMSEYENADLDIINCMITGNEADREHSGQGGGIYALSNNLQITNSTIADNNAYQYGGASINTYLTNLDNCIFWGNNKNPLIPEQQIYNGWYIDSTNIINHCDIEHSKSVLYDLGYGAGPKDYIVDLNFDPYDPDPDESCILGNDLGYNLPTPEEDGDPDFTVDYHLNSDSPCINAGDDAAAAGIPYDIDLVQPRIMGLHVDIGADEVMECLSYSAAEYSDWVAWGMPSCWCYQRQCRGDTDGEKSGVLWVSSADFNLLKSAYNKTDTVLKGVVLNGVPGICADLDHAKSGVIRVSTSDLNIFKSYYNKLETSVPCCDLDKNCILTTSDKYNFWTN